MLGSSAIPFLGNTTTTFLGMPVSPTLSDIHHRDIIATKVHDMLEKIDLAPLSYKYKLLIFRCSLPAIIGWFLKITSIPPSFVSRILEASSTQFLKKWLKMPRCANPSPLYPSSSGGLALPSITTMHKSLQATKLAALSLSQDPIVRELASRHLTRHQHHHGPAETVLDVISHHMVPSKSQTKVAVKKKIEGSDDAARFDNISSLEVQGRFWLRLCR